ncbi:MAG: PAS domain-containing protein [Deltaproteobacteria bacterium]|jgi:two-component system phosphate regulon sensor histidine kinase PhoR|nr:PAS domain-containing protein [Deltaproteobacteria bacterium]
MIAPAGSLRTRLFLAFALVTILAASLSALLARRTLYEDRLALARKQALAQAVFAANILNAGEEQARQLFSAAKELALRMTLTDSSGRVILDSHIEDAKLADLDSHKDRPEIRDALAAGLGVSLRRGDSLGIEAIYAAAPLKNGHILRVAVPLADIRENMGENLSSIILIIAGVAGFCLLLSMGITRRMRLAMDNMAEAVDAISRDRAHSRLSQVPAREFLPLAGAINHMADTIEDYVRTTSDQQSQLETILDSMHEGVLVLGPSGKIRRWNRALAAMLPSVAEAEGKSLLEGIPVPALRRRAEELLGNGAPEAALTAVNAAVQFELPPGRFLVAHLSRPVSPNDSLGAVLVIYDATEIMRLERMRRDFVSNVSHELRTPLTAIAGYAETLAASEDLDKRYRGFAGIIHKHATALAGVISNLLALARIEDARESINFTPASAETALRNALTACLDQAAATGVQFSIDLDDAPVFANQALLEQVFRNLLENACRYAPPQSEIRVRSRKQGREALFTVSDNGPGIPQEALPRIFERFYQVKKERNSGTAGVGLAICKHIIERHGGRIWAESPYGGAATAMLFTLPLALEGLSPWQSPAP